MDREQIKEQRGKTYGDFNRNLNFTALLYDLYKQACLNSGVKYRSGHDEAIHLVFHKVSRIAHGSCHEDNYVDGAIYLEQAFKCQNSESEGF